MLRPDRYAHGYACMIAGRLSFAAKLSCATPARIEWLDTAATHCAKSASRIGPSRFSKDAFRG